MDSGSDNEVLEIYSFTHSASFTKVKKRRSKRKMCMGAQYFLPTSIERRIPPYRYYTSVFEV